LSASVLIASDRRIQRYSSQLAFAISRPPCGPRRALAMLCQKVRISSRSDPHEAREAVASRPHRPGDPKAEGVEPDTVIAVEANRSADELALVVPGAPSDDSIVRVSAFEPR